MHNSIPLAIRPPPAFWATFRLAISNLVPAGAIHPAGGGSPNHSPRLFSRRYVHRGADVAGCPGAGRAVAGPAGSRHRRHQPGQVLDRKSTRLNSSHLVISYAVFCLKKKKILNATSLLRQGYTSSGCVVFSQRPYTRGPAATQHVKRCVCWTATRLSFFFFFNDTATTEIYTLSLHDALPIYMKILFDQIPLDQMSVSMRIFM